MKLPKYGFGQRVYYVDNSFLVKFLIVAKIELITRQGKSQIIYVGEDATTRPENLLFSSSEEAKTEVCKLIRLS